MKDAWLEFRMYLAELCLEVAERLAPRDTADGQRIRRWIYDYFDDVNFLQSQRYRKEPPR